jgi:hypothetical protein
LKDFANVVKKAELCSLPFIKLINVKKIISFEGLSHAYLLKLHNFNGF